MGQPRYLYIYDYYKDLIMREIMKNGTKLPSIRKASLQFQVSRTTMESAYLLLAAEGYILAKPQSGYYVTDVAERKNRNRQRLQSGTDERADTIRYDFVSTSVDRESFRFEVWRRYMKSALRQDERLLSYGEPQGETEFREVLCEYLKKERNVVSTPEQIVIGAGVQSLLHILCPLLEKDKRVSFHHPDFVQGKAVFEDYGFTIADNDMAPGTGIYYLTPSQMTRWGAAMNTADRMRLVEEAGRREILLIEDDYNSEFRYFQRQASSLQGLAGGQGVVYLGTFSKMLLPSIRMSYMVLPPALCKIYLKRSYMYNQTASKAEQIALTQFIRDGHLSSQIRKSRKIHLAKAEELQAAARKILPDLVDAKISESGFQVFIVVRTPFTGKEIEEKVRKKGVALLTMDEQTGTVTLVMNCANVASKHYEDIMDMIRESLEVRI